jgi:hypothetical protein
MTDEQVVGIADAVRRNLGHADEVTAALGSEVGT